MTAPDEGLSVAGFVLQRLDEEEQLAAGFPPRTARVVALVVARRRIVQAYVSIGVPVSQQQVVAQQALGYAVAQLSTPYADHPDYREEWAQ